LDNDYAEVSSMLTSMAADRTELNNLAAPQPGRLRTLVAPWEAWARRVHVLP
jgi:hypothetical protein